MLGTVTVKPASSHRDSQGGLQLCLVVGRQHFCQHRVQLRGLQRNSLREGHPVNLQMVLVG